MYFDQFSHPFFRCYTHGYDVDVAILGRSFSSAYLVCRRLYASRPLGNTFDRVLAGKHECRKVGRVLLHASNCPSINHVVFAD